MEGCSKTSAGGVPSLPDGPLLEILSRVPAKSVCRFKCVSKAWRDLIADPDNRKKLRQAMQGLFVQMSRVSDAEDEELVRMTFNFIDLAVRSVPLDIDSCFSFLTEMTGIEAFLLDSCNGLILLGQRQEPSHVLDGYIVCNPTTRQWSAVPACGCRHGITQTYLSIDPAVSPHFHLVHFQIVLVHVYSSETGTWSQNLIYEQKDQAQLEGWHHQFPDDVNQCAFVNGFLHVIAYSSDGLHILAVDTQGKVRRMITMPVMADGSQKHDMTCYVLGQSQGHLHCVTLEFWNEKISTWVLQDYDTQEWVLKNSVNSLDVFGKRKEWRVFDVVDIHQDCNVVFFYHCWNHELIAYNMDSKDMSVIATFEDRKELSDFARYIPCFSESPALKNKY